MTLNVAELTEMLDEVDEICHEGPAGVPMEFEIAPYMMRPGSGTTLARTDTATGTTKMTINPAAVMQFRRLGYLRFIGQSTFTAKYGLVVARLLEKLSRGQPFR